MSTAIISQDELDKLRKELSPLLGLKLDWLSLPVDTLKGFEPSQIAVIVNTLVDAALPQIELLGTDKENVKKLKKVGLSKAPRLIGFRESYPDYIHSSGNRIELKGLYVDNPELNLIRPPTQREPSARLKENITMDNVIPDKDVLLIAAIRFEKFDKRCHPVIIDLGLFPMAECITSRDQRLAKTGGKWINGRPSVVSKRAELKQKNGEPLTDSDFEKDTNFGKLKRIPYEPLQKFMRKHGAI